MGTLLWNTSLVQSIPLIILQNLGWVFALTAWPKTDGTLSVTWSDQPPYAFITVLLILSFHSWIIGDGWKDWQNLQLDLDVLDTLVSLHCSFFNS